VGRPDLLVMVLLADARRMPWQGAPETRLDSWSGLGESRQRRTKASTSYSLATTSVAGARRFMRRGWSTRHERDGHRLGAHAVAGRAKCCVVDPENPGLLSEAGLSATFRAPTTRSALHRENPHDKEAWI
jgi:hypothetical protein